MLPVDTLALEVKFAPPPPPPGAVVEVGAGKVVGVRLGVRVGVRVGPVEVGVGLAVGVVLTVWVGIGMPSMQVLPGWPRQKLGAALGARNEPFELWGLIARLSQWKR